MYSMPNTVGNVASLTSLSHFFKKSLMAFLFNSQEIFMYLILLLNVRPI